MPKMKEQKDERTIFDNQILRIEQVKEMLQFSEAHIYRLVSLKEIPAYKKGKTLFFMKDEIIEWLREGATQK